MSPLEFIQAFHIIRPGLLLLLPAIILLWWFVRRSLLSPALPRDGLAEHLRQALLLDVDRARRITPLDTVGLALLLAAFAASGPAWSRVPAPFVAQSAPAVIVLEVTDSMTSIDVAPTRLERAKQKIRDLVELRAGARTALVAYAGSAHLVVPMTEDAKLMDAYLAGLSPDIMPETGSDATAAWQIASDLLDQETSPGGILYVLDGLNANDLENLQAGQQQHPLAFLRMLPEEQQDNILEQMPSDTIVAVSINDSDLRQLDRMLNVAYRQAMLEDTAQPWDDKGLLFAWPAALLVLVWFRRGWTMQWVWLLAIGTVLAPAGEARAEGMKDWFLTPDQQGWLEYRNRHFHEAADSFTDPEWKAYMLYRDGQYGEAADTFRRLDTPRGHFGAGMADIRNRQYREAIDDFQKVVDLAPDYPGAQENLALAKQILEYVESTREQSDTGEDGGMGADEVVLDNEDNRGVETQIERPQNTDMQLLTTEQWMNTVDTRTGDFLRQRFAIEAARATRQGE